MVGPSITTVENGIYNWGLKGEIFVIYREKELGRIWDMEAWSEKHNHWNVISLMLDLDFV